MGYAKVFESLFDGSLRGMSDEILVFVNMLTHASGEGVVDIHFRKISDETGLSQERVRDAAKYLESPDKDSRTPDEQGRRIKRLDDHRDWGWRIVNHWKYRMMGGQDERTKELTRQRVKNFRAKKQHVEPSGNVSVTLPPASASASVQQGNRGVGEEGATELPPGFPKTEQEAGSHAQFVGCDAEFSAAVWNKAKGRGGRDSKDIPVRSFRHHLATEWGYERARRAKNGSQEGKLTWHQKEHQENLKPKIL